MGNGKGGDVGFDGYLSPPPPTYLHAGSVKFCSSFRLTLPDSMLAVFSVQQDSVFSLLLSRDDFRILF